MVCLHRRRKFFVAIQSWVAHYHPGFSEVSRITLPSIADQDLISRRL
jgi:hypothetical protein